MDSMKMIFARIVACAGLAASGLFGFIASAHSQTWPTKPIELTVPYPPGGSSDVIARLIGIKLQDALKQPVLIINRPGAGTVIGTNFVARAEASGHQLLLADNPFLINATVMGDLAYDPLKDFSPIAIIGTAPQLIFTSPQGSKTLSALIDRAKQKPGTVTIGNAGAGSLTHLLAAMTENQAGVKFNHIPYKGSAPALTDAMGGQVDAAISSTASGLTYATSGKLRALAVTSEKRITALPDVPTFEELGFKNMVIDNWWGFVAPAGTPKAVVDRLHAELSNILAMADVRERYLSLGLTPAIGTPAAFRKTLETELVQWNKVVKLNNIKIE